MFVKRVSAHKGCIYLIKNTVIFFKYYYYVNQLFSLIIYIFIPVIKAEFSVSLLQSSVSHDPSNIISIFIGAQLVNVS